MPIPIESMSFMQCSCDGSKGKLCQTDLNVEFDDLRRPNMQRKVTQTQMREETRVERFTCSRSVTHDISKDDTLSNARMEGSGELERKAETALLMASLSCSRLFRDVKSYLILTL